ncbi:hypothetical protein K4G95_23405, partial [Mycobacterium tuberculosis]|nr:hypothetical protein [Mycobacterium tuberculosis]
PLTAPAFARPGYAGFVDENVVFSIRFNEFIQGKYAAMSAGRRRTICKKPHLMVAQISESADYSASIHAPPPQPEL